MRKGRPENFRGGISNAERLKCTAPSLGLNTDQHPELRDFLPKDYQYHVCSYKAVGQPSAFDHVGFEATLRMSLHSKEDFLQWLKAMPVTWRLYTSRPTKGQKIIFKQDFRCQHGGRAAPKTGKATKNTHCDAKLKVAIVRTRQSSNSLLRCRSTDPHLPAYPTIVEIKNTHNHSIYGSESLRNRDVGAAAVEKLTELFKAGHSASSALDVLKCGLQLTHGDDYIAKSADRSICPDPGFCQRLYNKIRAGSGSAEGNGIIKMEPPESDSESVVLEDAARSAEQPLSRSTMSATVGLGGAETSDVFDRKEFCSDMDEFKRMVLNNEGLQGGALVMMKTLRRLMGNPSMLLSAMHRFGTRFGVANRAGKVKLRGRGGRLAAGRPAKRSAASTDRRNSLPKPSVVSHSQLAPKKS